MGDQLPQQFLANAAEIRNFPAKKLELQQRPGVPKMSGQEDAETEGEDLDAE